MHSTVRKAPRRAPRAISRLADGGPVMPPMPSASASPAAPAPMAAAGGSPGAPSNMLTDPANTAARNASVKSVLGPSAAASPSQSGPQKDPFDHSSVDLLDPTQIAARNSANFSVFPSARPAAASAGPTAQPAPGPSLAAQDATRLAANPFGFADGGIVPAPAPPPVSPYSILGIANSVSSGYNAARGAATNAMESVHNRFSAPPGYTPAVVGAQPAPAAPAAVPAPAPAPLPQLGGMNLNVMQRREAAAGLKNGGPVLRMATGGKISGPGTGTSDSIAATMPAGSYVVPADTTQQMQTPVKVSTGETALTPEDVHAVGTAALNSADDPHGAGTAALDVLRKITHRSVHGARRGKANGGPVSALTSIGSPASAALERTAGPVSSIRTVLKRADGGQVYGSQIAMQIPTDGYGNVPAPDGSQGAPGRVPVSSTGGATGTWVPATAAAPPNPTDQRLAQGTQAAAPAAPGPVSSMVDSAPGVVKMTAPGASTLYTNVPGATPATMTLGPVSTHNQQALDNLSAKYDAQALAGATMMGPSAAANASLPGLTGAWIPGITAPASQSEQQTAARNQQFDQDESKQQALRGGRLAVDVLNNQNTNTTNAAVAGVQQSGATQRIGMTEAGANQRAQLQNATEMQLRGPLTGIAVQEAGQKILQGQQAMAAQKAYQDALASGDPKAIDQAEMALRGQTGHLPMRYEAGAGGTMDPDTLHNLAVQYIGGDHSVLNGLGGGAMGAINRGSLLQAVTTEMQARGFSPEQINARKTDFASEMAGAGAAGKRQAGIDMAATEAAQTFGLVRQLSANVSRTQFVPANQALNSFRANTGDPNVVAYGAGLNALMHQYVRATSGGGVPTDAEKGRAEAMLSAAHTPQQLEATLNMMEREIEYARNSPKMVAQDRSARLGAGPTTGAPPTAGAAPGAPPANAAPATSSSGISNRIATANDYAQLPSGSVYTTPDGVTRRKP